MDAPVVQRSADRNGDRSRAVDAAILAQPMGEVDFRIVLSDLHREGMLRW